MASVLSLSASGGGLGRLIEWLEDRPSREAMLPWEGPP